PRRARPPGQRRPRGWLPCRRCRPRRPDQPPTTGPWHRDVRGPARPGAGSSERSGPTGRPGRRDLAVWKQWSRGPSLLPREARLEKRSHTGGRAEQLEGVVGVSGHVAVADQHPDVSGQTLGPEGRGREAGGHREEDHRAALGGGEDRW